MLTYEATISCNNDQCKLLDKLKAYNRLVIVGPPRVGKTKVALKYFSDHKVISTDDFIKTVAWADVPEHVIGEVEKVERFVIEGVQTARILRKGKRLGIFEPDAIILLSPTHEADPKHVAMRKATAKIFGDYINETIEDNIPVFELTENDFE